MPSLHGYRHCFTVSCFSRLLFGQKRMIQPIPRMRAELARERERKKKSKLRKSKLSETDKRKKEKRAAEWKWTRTIYPVLRRGAGTLILSCRWIRAPVFARSACQNGKRLTATQHLRETYKMFMHSAQRLLHPSMRQWLPIIPSHFRLKRLRAAREVTIERVNARLRCHQMLNKTGILETSSLNTNDEKITSK